MNQRIGVHGGLCIFGMSWFNNGFSKGHYIEVIQQKVQLTNF